MAEIHSPFIEQFLFLWVSGQCLKLDRQIKNIWMIISLLRCSICRIIIMGLGNWVFDELKIANSCYMAAAIEFNYAMFHIFTGPLFTNLEGYAFLDLLIWGVSPLIFEAFRVPLRKYVQPWGWATSPDQKRMVVNRRFWWFVGCFLAIAISYLFMNYSPNFRWNYFSRIINLDFGYLLFDLACRCMELVVEVEQQQQHHALLVQESDTLEPILHSGGYCKYRNIFMMASYFLVFYLSTVYDPNDLNSGIDIFSALSIICVLFTLSIPLLYIFRHRHQSYGAISQQEEEPQDIDAQVPVAAVSGQEDPARLNVLFCLISFSYFVNISYFSMWIMEGFRQEKDNQSQQFNKSLLISSAFFLIASFLQFVVANSYIGCKLREGVMEDKFLPRLVRPFLIGYGLLILGMFTASHNMEWHYMVAPILFFGLHNILVTHLTERIEERRNRDKSQIGYHKLFFYCETIAYLAIPALLTIIGLADSAIYIFGFISGGSLVIAGAYF